jgi:uncharacterized OB-fold protein
MTRPLPKPTPETQPFWDAVQKGEFWLPYCSDTGKCFFPPRAYSPFTGGAVEWREATGQGTLESFVIPAIPGPGFEDRMPYAVAMAKLDEGITFIATIDGVSQDDLLPRLGDRLEIIFEEEGGMKLPAFRMLENADV